VIVQRFCLQGRSTVASDSTRSVVDCSAGGCGKEAATAQDTTTSKAPAVRGSPVRDCNHRHAEPYPTFSLIRRGQHPRATNIAAWSSASGIWADLEPSRHRCLLQKGEPHPGLMPRTGATSRTGAASAPNAAAAAFAPEPMPPRAVNTLWSATVPS